MKYLILFFILVYSNLNAQNKEQLSGLRISSAWASFLDKDLPNRYHSRGMSYDIDISTHIMRPRHIGLIAEIGYAQKKGNYAAGQTSFFENQNK